MEKRHSRKITLLVFSLSLVLMIGMLLPDSGYSQTPPAQKRTVAAGEKATIKGVILSRAGETFVMRDMSRTDTIVALTDTTKIRTVRKGLFRGHKPFDVTALMPGLIVEAKGIGDSEGRLTAEDIQFTEEDLKAAITASARTAPVEDQLAKTRQEVQDTNKRISSLDEFDVVKKVSVLFAVNSATLGKEAKAQLDELASKAPGGKNYMVEVRGFADPTGNAEKNLELSQRRANAVVQYLAAKHNIPMRRIMVPMGYGETKSGGDAKQDRRVDVMVLVNKGLNK